MKSKQRLSSVHVCETVSREGGGLHHSCLWCKSIKYQDVKFHFLVQSYRRNTSNMAVFRSETDYINS